MRVLPALVGTTCLFSSCLAVTQPQSQLPLARVSDQRAQAVKDAFQFAWSNYYRYAFPDDELNPVSNTTSNSRNGWGASAVDALSTALVMRDRTTVNQILDHIPNINYAASYQDGQVSLFETTIRYLAGMLSAYDFLTGPLAAMADNEDNVKALLTQSENLANVLSFAFKTPSGIPSNNLYINNQSFDSLTYNGLAQIGTLVLEWTKLSDLTGNSAYTILAQIAESHLLKPLPSKDEPFPGLLGTNVGLTHGRFRDARGGWIGGDDSFYEYLIKMFVYDAGRFGDFRDRWLAAVESSMEHLASHPSTRPDLMYLAMYNGPHTTNYSQHLACFDGGNFLLGGSVLDRQDIVDFGLSLVEACHNTYISTATGIGPKIFEWNTTTLPEDQTAFYEMNGFWVSDPSYDLRPEVIESYYHAYQITKDPMYQDWAWDAFVAINASCRTDLGFSKISNVTIPGGGSKLDNQESFLFAELMKYSYMIQSQEEPWDVNANGVNEWVYNTEAHPLRVAGKPV